MLPGKFTLGVVLALLACSVTESDAASACKSVNQASERGKLQRLLSSNGFAKGESAFLLAGAEQRLNELKSQALNAHGVQCGIGIVRAHVLGCMNSALPFAFGTIPADKKASKALWGRTGLSARGSAFIGMFHACRGGAVESFVSR